MKHATYIIGEPGVGKTTLVKALTDTVDAEVHMEPFGHEHYKNGVTQLGYPRETFGGTDALGMAVQPQAVEFIRTKDAGQLLLMEGDRLANGKFWTQLERNGWTLHVYLLWGPMVAAARRESRSAVTGKVQDASWVNGRRSKAQKLAREWNATTLSAIVPVDILVRSLTDPVTEAFLPGWLEASNV